jgi:hypothetical protein
MITTVCGACRATSGLELLEVQPEPAARVKPMRHDGTRRELVIRGERRQAQQHPTAGAGQQGPYQLAGTVADCEPLRRHAGVLRHQLGDRAALRRIVRDHPLQRRRRKRAQPPIATSVAYGFERKQASTSISPGTARSSSTTLGECVPAPACSAASASRTARSSGLGAGAQAAAGAPQPGWARQWRAPGARHILH